MTQFVTALLFVLLCLPLTPSAQVLTSTDTTEIAENVYSFRYGTSRSLWVEMDNSIIVIDPLNTTVAAVLYDSIQAATDKPVSHVIYSHEHYDHIKGAKIFKDAGATIISHENCRDTFDYAPDPEAIPPDVTFSGDYEVPVPGTKIELLYFGRNHGDCMVFPHFPEHRLLMMVDMLANKSLPFGSLPDYYPADMVRTLTEISALDFDRITRGHSEAIVGREVLDDTLAYWSDLMAAVKAELDRGTGALDAIETVDLPQYREWRNYDRWFKLHVERVMWYYALGW